MASSKVPLPDLVQVELLALPPRVPDKVWVLPAHIVASIPAPTVAIGLIVSTMSLFTEVHGPVGSSVVMVKVIVPEVMSAADGL